MTGGLGRSIICLYILARSDGGWNGEEGKSIWPDGVWESHLKLAGGAQGVAAIKEAHLVALLHVLVWVEVGHIVTYRTKSGEV